MALSLINDDEKDRRNHLVVKVLMDIRFVMFKDLIDVSDPLINISMCEFGHKEVLRSKLLVIKIFFSRKFEFKINKNKTENVINKISITLKI